MNKLIEMVRVRANTPGSIHDMAGGLSPAPRIHPPATVDQIVATEKRLGFELPLLLKRIYMEIGNGGFGPGYGLIGVETSNEPDFTLKTLGGAYSKYHKPSEDSEQLPKKMLPVCTWGCAIYSFLDCSIPEVPVLILDEDSHVVDNALQAILKSESGEIIEEYESPGNKPRTPMHASKTPKKLPLSLHKSSLEQWLTDWANGVDLWTEMEGL